MGLLRVLIYGIIFGVYAGSLTYDIRFVRVGNEPYISRFVMLTYINFVLQTVYSGICLISALVDWKEELAHGDRKKQQKHVHLPSYWRQTTLHKMCDFMYATSAFPVGMATSLIFWALFFIDPNLVRADAVAQIIPSFLNHVTHSAPIGFLLVDTLLTCHHVPPRRTGTLVVLGLYAIYLAILFGTRIVNGYWLYPIFYYLSNVQVFTFLFIAGVCFWLLYIIGDGLNTTLWGKRSNSFVCLSHF
jgi:hypothetical protein